MAPLNMGTGWEKHFLLQYGRKNFVEFGNPYQFTWGDYRGTRVGLFTCNETEEKGYIDVDFFKYERK